MQKKAAPVGEDRLASSSREWCMLVVLFSGTATDMNFESSMGLNMLKLALACALAMLLAGCATPANLGWQSRYHGVPVEAFFAEWGAPVAQHKIYDGTTAYLWFTGRNSAYRPGRTDSELIGNTAWWKGYTLKEYMTNLECGVRIFTWPDGTIRDVLLREANAQWWEHYRCREVFGAPKRPAS
jgi:hypothetical protein